MASSASAGLPTFHAAATERLSCFTTKSGGGACVVASGSTRLRRVDVSAVGLNERALPKMSVEG